MELHVISTPCYVFVAWCLIKHLENFITYWGSILKFVREKLIQVRVDLTDVQLRLNFAKFSETGLITREVFIK